MSLKSVVRAAVPRKVRNWLRSPARTAQWASDCARYALGARMTVPLLPSWSVVCHPQAYRVIRKAQLEDPEQREEFLHFAQHCRKSMLLFDVGAHFGVFSLAAAHFGGKAVAIDPSRTATRMIAREAALNHCEDSIQILRAAVSDAHGVLELLEAGVFTYGYYKVAKDRSRRELTAVPAVTVDELAERYGSPTHIKIDVEGHEAAVLRGSRNTLTTHRPVLFLEIHNEMISAAGDDPGWILAELHNLSYRIASDSGQPSDSNSTRSKPIARIIAQHVESYSESGSK